MKHDTNEDINAWFNFILDMADEQLFVAIGRIPSIDNRFIVNDNDIKKIRILWNYYICKFRGVCSSYFGNCYV